MEMYTLRALYPFSWLVLHLIFTSHPATSTWIRPFPLLLLHLIRPANSVVDFRVLPKNGDMHKKAPHNDEWYYDNKKFK